MSKEFEKKIEDLFLGESVSIDSESLNKIINEVFLSSISEQGAEPVQQTSTETEQILRMLPKMEFNEKKVGVVGNQERQEVRMVLGKELNSAKDLRSKLQIINSLTSKSDDKKLTSIEALRKLMILKIFKNLFVGSSPGPSGYRFEAFIAALLGGEQIIPKEGGLIDVVVDNKLYQVKLIAQGSSVRIKRKMASTIQPTQQKNKDNDLQSTEQPKKQSNKKINVKNEKLSDSPELNFIIATKNNDSSVSFYEYTATKEQIAGEADQEGKTTVEFTITKTQYESKGVIGVININDSEFINLSNKLQDGLKQVLLGVASLVNNVNKFYLNNDTGAAKEGIQNANTVSSNLIQQI